MRTHHRPSTVRRDRCVRWLPIGLLIVVALVGMGEAAAQPALLLPGSYHGEEVAAASGSTWWALVQGETGWALEEVELTVEQEFDPLIDDEGSASGKRISVSTDAPVVALVRGVSGLLGGAVPTTRTSLANLRPESPASFRLGVGDPWSLSLVLDRDPRDVEGATPDCRLILTRGGVEQTLAEYRYCSTRNGQLMVGNEASITLHWAGDMDRDGRLDLLIDLTDHYNVSKPTLFLSSKAGQGKLVGKVAEHVSVGC